MPATIKFGNEKASCDSEKATIFNLFIKIVYNSKEPTLLIYTKSKVNFIKTLRLENEEFSQNLDLNKSTGLDNLGNNILRNCAKTLSKYLLLLFQTILNKGIFPQLRKVSQITPVYKEGSKADVNCYRPISLLCCVSKLMERIIFNRIYSHCKNNLFENQFGFRQRRSATTQLLLFLNSLYAKLDDVKTKELSVLYLDFAKAFDKFSHNKLIEKLHFFKIGRNLLKLIESYFNRRKQCVKIDNALSERIEITAGVPKGSILGPLLFLIFINAIPPETPLIENFGFADDFKLISVYQKELKKNVTGIENWCDRNHMTLNASNCKLLLSKANKKLL